MSIYESCIGF